MEFRSLTLTMPPRSRRSLVRCHAGSIDRLFDYFAPKPVTGKESSWNRLEHLIKGLQTHSQKATRSLSAVQQKDDSTGGKHADQPYIPALWREFSAEDSVGKLVDELQEEMAYALGYVTWGKKLESESESVSVSVLVYLCPVLPFLQSLTLQTIVLPSLLPPYFLPPGRNNQPWQPQAGSHKQRRALAAEHNFRAADFARRKLMIHIQACGYSWRNHEIVCERFPLPDFVRLMSDGRCLALLREMSTNKLGSSLEKAEIVDMLRSEF